MTEKNVRYEAVVIKHQDGVPVAYTIARRWDDEDGRRCTRFVADLYPSDCYNIEIAVEDALAWFKAHGS